MGASPTVTPKKPAGSTPTTVKGTWLSVIVSPRIVARAPKLLPPVRVADDRDGRSPGAVVVGCQQPPGGGLHAERAVVRTSHGHHRGDAGRPARAHADGRLPRPGKQANERLVPLAHGFELGERHERIGLPAFRVKSERDQPVGLVHRQGAQHDRVVEREDGARAPDPERERDDTEGGKEAVPARRRSPSRTSCITDANARVPHMSRVTSRTSVTLPKARCAAALASSGAAPRSTRSLASSARWKAISSSTSRSDGRRRQSHMVVSSLYARPHDARNHRDDLGPARVRRRELALAGREARDDRSPAERESPSHSGVGAGRCARCQGIESGCPRGHSHQGPRIRERGRAARRGQNRKRAPMTIGNVRRALSSLDMSSPADL